MSVLKEKAAKLWERDPNDWYVEGRRPSQQLFNAEKFVGKIHDPCCGGCDDVGGSIIKSAFEAGYDVSGSDIEDRFPPDGPTRPWWRGTQDFLETPDYITYDNLVFNPPFFRAEGAENFIRKALNITRGKVCAFVDIRFIAGGARANGLYRDFKPHRIWIVTPRVSCPPGTFLRGGNSAGNGSSDWVWLVWDNASPPSAGPVTGWLTASHIPQDE